MTGVQVAHTALILWFALSGMAGLWLGRIIRTRDEQIPTSDERFAGDATPDERVEEQ